MSPNGLRRWRRYAKKCRYRSRKEGKVSNATGASLRALFFAARIHPNYAVPPKPFTARSLVGMSQKARKRLRHDRLFGPNVAPTKLLLADSLTVQLHIGERLRPCPGCPSCTDSPRLQVMGYARRIGGRVRIDRTLDVSGRSVFYVIMFSWRHEGPMQKLRGFETKQLAWEHLQEYWGYRGHLPRLCDGSGVLPARRS